MDDPVPIPGCDGYFVTRDGRVFSRWRRGRHYSRGPTAELRELRRTKQKTGYLGVSLGPGRREHAHVIVLSTFVGPRPPRHESRHLNGDRADNRVENLCWGTVSENQMDRAAHGTSNRGERNGAARLSASDVLRVRGLLAGDTRPRAVAVELGVGVATIRDIAKGRTWAWLP